MFTFLLDFIVNLEFPNILEEEEYYELERLDVANI